MQRRVFGLAVLLASMGTMPLAFAQAGGDPRGPQGRPGQNPRDPRGPQASPPRAPQAAQPSRQRYDARPSSPGQNARHASKRPSGSTPAARNDRGAGPDHAFHRGDRLPSRYRHHQYVVNDWRAHRLSPPPRGQQWVQVGGDYVLIAIATGVITGLILTH